MKNGRCGRKRKKVNRRKNTGGLLRKIGREGAATAWKKDNVHLGEYGYGKEGGRRHSTSVSVYGAGKQKERREGSGCERALRPTSIKGGPLEDTDVDTWPLLHLVGGQGEKENLRKRKGFLSLIIRARSKSKGGNTPVHSHLSIKRKGIKAGKEARAFRERKKGKKNTNRSIEDFVNPLPKREVGQDMKEIKKGTPEEQIVGSGEIQGLEKKAPLLKGL